MTDYAKLADLAAQAIWNATLEDDPEQGTWEDAHEAVKAKAREEMEEFARVLYPVFLAHALPLAAQSISQAVERKQSSDTPNPLSWQTGALWVRDRLLSSAEIWRNSGS